ncbi:DnaJ-domain-containing protein [Mytilinidion resinicola]|uniref:DnaJ-domain-containing protein n=1 Tax=Mytilinidion resinicola TaxID=574789 RepID=A0A6A6YJA1_9PEZI|nr:DnaJ-domain-containing protein [Mytilinidion resinicola]KAF2808649.1 DnaJ-domain-containing protein [Mytilinidion resinicola]
MSNTQSPYVTLGVARGADEKTIRSAYHRLAREHHPDKIQDSALSAAGEEKFKTIQHAYELLTGKAKHAEVDNQAEPQPARPPPRRRTPSPSPYDGIFRAPSDSGSCTDDEDAYRFRKMGRAEAAAHSTARKANHAFKWAQEQWSEAEAMLVHAKNAEPKPMILYSNIEPTRGPESCREAIAKGRVPESVLSMHTIKWQNSESNLRSAIQHFDEASASYKRAERVFKRAARLFDNLDLDEHYRENRNMAEEARRLAAEATVKADESEKKFEETAAVASAWSHAGSGF